jgi:3D (Asp-Asp-Asp) domain-containing protein
MKNLKLQAKEVGRKNRNISLILPLLFLSSAKATNLSEPKGDIVTATVYNAIEGQTDNSPLITASGFKIDKENFPMIIAVSKDLEKKFPLGSEVEVCNVDHLEGIYRVEDRMHHRWRKKIDILVPDSIKLGKWTNARIRRID